jgi:hypothetical protein
MPPKVVAADAFVVDVCENPIAAARCHDEDEARERDDG